MRCAKCQKLYDEAVRGALPEKLARRVEEHVSSCPACSAYWQENEMLGMLVRETAAPATVPEANHFARMARRVVATCESEGSRAAVRRPGLVEQIVPARAATRSAFAWLAHAAVFLAIGAVIGLVVSRGARDLTDREAGSPAVAALQPTPAPIVGIAEPPAAPVSSAGESPEPTGPILPEPTLAQAFAMEEDMGRGQAAADSAIIMKKPEEAETATGLVELAQARPDIVGVDPQLVFETWRGFVTLLDKMGPSDEVERLRRIQRLSSQVKVASVLNSLQDLKLQLVRSGQTKYIGVVHQVEGLLNELALVSPGSQNVYVPQLQTYQKAEQALIEGRYRDAMKLFQLVVIHAPESYLAARARYQMGNINFEYYHDYENALFDYKKCLEDFPSHFLSDAILRQIHERVDLIMQNAAYEYAPLRFWQKAESAKESRAAVALYAELIRSYPNSSLVRRAIDALARIARKEGSEALANEVLELLDQFQSENPNHPDAQWAQLAMADLTYYPLRDKKQARLDYSRLLREAEDPDLIEALQSRLRELDREQ